MRLLPVFAVLTGLAACGDPLAGVDRLGDVDVAPQETAAPAALPDAAEVAREGFLGTAAAQGEVPAEALAPAPEPQAQAQGGFFSRLVRRAAAVDPAEAVAADVAASLSPPDAEDAEVVLAAVPEAAAPERKRGGLGLFGGREQPAPDAQTLRKGPDARDVPYGTTLAFGEIARVCDAQGQPLGTRIEGGRRGFALYDSTPDSATGRTFYITGFSDDCPRQFTAANALFGVPSFYEQIRFGPAGEHLPFAATDQAYDKVKSAVCGAGAGKPCGSKIAALDETTAFISAYEFLDENTGWKEFLVHGGIVLAAAVKSLD